MGKDGGHLLEEYELAHTTERKVNSQVSGRIRPRAAKGVERAERYQLPSLGYSRRDESAPVIFSSCAFLLNTQVPGREVSLAGSGCLVTCPPTKEVVGTVTPRERLHAGLARAPDIPVPPELARQAPQPWTWHKGTARELLLVAALRPAALDPKPRGLALSPRVRLWHTGRWRLNNTLR